MQQARTTTWTAVLSLVALACASGCDSDRQASRQRRAAAVEVAPVTRGDITLLRVFSGGLEAAAEFVVSPKVGGRVKRVHFDLGDRVPRGAVVVELDDDEHRQQVAQAVAELAVAKATVVEAQSALATARRELERVTTLHQRGVASITRLDSVSAVEQAAAAQLEVATAQVARAEALVQGARIRLGYTRVTADWHDGGDQRVLAERFVDPGETVAANASLATVVELDPIVGVVHVPERDYAHLQVGQPATLSSDAFPGEPFAATLQRIAPVFRPGSRQARVELRVDNPEHRLKPGLFIRATVAIDRAEGATIVPLSALASRGETTGVFIVDASGARVAWRPVRVGIREGERVQVQGDHIEGRVVSLGQQLLDDGSAISIPYLAKGAATDGGTE